MSYDRIEIVRAVIERWNAGDRDFDSISEYCDPAIELQTPFSSVTGQPYKGFAGVEQWVHDVDDQFSKWRIGIDELRLVADRVLAMVTVAGRGRASDLALDFQSASVFDFGSDHRVTHMRIYRDVDEALKAVGLKE